MRTVCLMLLLALLAPLHVHAAEYHVCQDKGDDGNDGSAAAPFRTILRAVKAAGAGDTVHLVPGQRPWRESVALNTHPTWYHRGGEPGKPLTIDGHGAWITGADPCPPEGWKEAADGVWTHSGMAYSGFMVIEGRFENQVTDLDVAEPGEMCYQGWGNRLYYRVRDRQPVPAVEIGQPGDASFTIDPKDWQYAGRPGIVRYCGAAPKPDAVKPPTWVKIDGTMSKLVQARERLAPGRFTVAEKTLYYRPPEGKRPADMAIEAVVRGNGVYMGGTTSHVVIRNFNVRHVFNDGYNIHGGCKDIAFYNCNAEDCGDEGFSAHSDCETLLDGAVYLRCDNGIFNVIRSVSVARNVIIADCRSVGYGGDQQTRHTLENVILINNPGQLSAPNVTARNLLVVSTGKGKAGTALGLGGECVIEQATVVGPYGYRLAHLYGARKVALVRCRFESAGSGPLHIRDNDPGILGIRDSLFSADTVIEWGAAQPFKRLKLADAAADPALPFAGARTIEAPLLEALARGERPAEMPKDSGCTPELIQRYLEFAKRTRHD